MYGSCLKTQRILVVSYHTYMCTTYICHIILYVAATSDYRLWLAIRYLEWFDDDNEQSMLSASISNTSITDICLVFGSWT